MDVFEAIADERRALADDLTGLPPDRQRTPSLCARWTVHDVLAHLTMPMEVSLPAFAVAMVVAGGNYDRANERLTRRLARRPFAENVDVLRRKADVRFTPPGAGPEAPLTDALVHALDIRRPLGLHRDVPEDCVRTALAHLMTAPSGVVPKGVLQGLRFEATDLDWAHGEGPVVRDSVDDLLLLCTGRVVALETATGEGVSVLRGRLA
jgi:uncharacterized protein (TIGR03083 family)